MTMMSTIYFYKLRNYLGRRKFFKTPYCNLISVQTNYSLRLHHNTMLYFAKNINYVFTFWNELTSSFPMMHLFYVKVKIWQETYLIYPKHVRSLNENDLINVVNTVNKVFIRIEFQFLIFGSFLISLLSQTFGVF